MVYGRKNCKMYFNKNIPELDVTSLDESIKFYETCGFKIEYERKDERFVFLSLGEIQFMLQELDDNNKWETGKLEYPFGRGINFQLEVDNVDSIYEKVVNNGYKIMVDIEENCYRQDDKYLGNKEFLVQDPDGYLLRFSEDLGSRDE